MRLWPHKRWKKVALVLCLIFIVMVVLSMYAIVSINKDVVGPIDVMNAGGNQTALVVYQPGLSSGPKDNAYAFANGLASAGWRVETTTASPEAPSNLSNYSLLVLVYPIYGGRPGEAEDRYVERLGDLQHIKVVIINVRWAHEIEDYMKQKVEAQNGTVLKSLLAGATDIRQAGSEIAPFPR